MISKQAIRIPGENGCSEITVLLVKSLLVLSLLLSCWDFFWGGGEIKQTTHTNLYLSIHHLSFSNKNKVMIVFNGGEPVFQLMGIVIDSDLSIAVPL